MKIFIAGGTGFVGGHVIRELLARGHELRLLVHRRSPALDGAEQVEGDITSLESFETAAEGCNAVINLVGIIREFPSRGITFDRLHLQGTKNMLAAAQKSGIKRYLQMSALGTRADAVSDYHKSKFLSEELVRSSGLEWTIFRPSLIYGPEDAFINMLAEQLRLLPMIPVIGNGKYRLQPIHSDDVARCFSMALEMPDTVGHCYELCGNDRLKYIDLLDAVAEAIGKPEPIKIRLPLMLMIPVVRLLQRFSSFPVTMDQLLMLLEENICDGCWKDTFCFEPRVFDEGIREYL